MCDISNVIPNYYDLNMICSSAIISIFFNHNFETEGKWFVLFFSISASNKFQQRWLIATLPAKLNFLLLTFYDQFTA